MTEEKKFEMESLQDRETVCKYLEALKEGFIQGVINLSSNEENLSVVPGGLIKFTIKAKKKNGEVKLNLRFRWADMETPETDSKVDTNALSDHEKE